MKKLLLILAVLLSVNCIAQNRFEKQYFCDTCYLNKVSIKVDSLKLNEVFKVIESDTTKVTLTKEQCLYLYFTGYLNGSLNYKAKGSFDFDELLIDVKRAKRLMKSNPIELK